MIENLVLPARLVLAVVFIFAGVAKLLDPVGGRRALAGFAVPPRFVAPLAIALPLMECAVAVALLATATAWVASLAALLLLTGFMVAIAANLLRGRTPDCHCFGRLHSAPIGRVTLYRVGALAVVAAFLAGTARAAPGASLFAGFADLTWPEDVAGLAILGLLVLSGTQAVMVYQLVLQQGRLLLRLDEIETQRHMAGLSPSVVEPVVAKSREAKPNPGLRIGAPAPLFELTDLENNKVSSTGLLAGRKPLLLMFTNPKCGPCADLMPEITHWALDPDLPVRIVMVSEGTIADNVLKFPLFGDPLVFVQARREVAEAYKANGTPAAVVVRTDGTIGSALALGADDIRELVDSLDADPTLRPNAVAPALPPAEQPRLLAVGEAVSSLVLADRDGALVRLDRFAGEDTLLLFWNPQCGFCQRMLTDLRAWAAAPPPGAPKIVVVRMGAPEAIDDMDLDLPVYTDPASRVSSALGANGTPMGILVGSDNRIAAPVAAGAHAVFALAGRSASEAAA